MAVNCTLKYKKYKNVLSCKVKNCINNRGLNEISEWKSELLKNEKCIICGKEVNINQSGKVIPFTKRIFTKKLYFCSEECYTIWSQQEEAKKIKKIKKSQRFAWTGLLLELVFGLIMVIVIIFVAIIIVAGG